VGTMNKFLKKILLGLIIWGIPFFISLFVWDIKKNAPIVSMAWFNALMAFTWAIGFGIATVLYFKDIKKKDAHREGWKIGFVWYIELLILDLIVLVGLFRMAIGDYLPLLLTYLNSVIICGAIGNIIKK